MARFGKEDRELTRQYLKEKRFLDRKSKVLVRLDGTLRIVLSGVDKSNLRLQCFERDGYKCVDAGDGHTCYGPLEMSHDPAMSKSAGSDVLEQVFARCWRAHVIFDKKNCPAHF
jgi:hypothetical protein